MFANPFMLLGLAVAVLPILVHLLSRARYRTVDWGGMMFLEGVRGDQSQSRRPKQWLLLLIRTAIVALLALALARPELHGRFAPATRTPLAGQRAGVVAILLDCSGSMAFDENGTSRMALAKESAKQLLSLHPGEAVSLVLMGQPQSPADRAPTMDLWDLGRRIESAEPGIGRADAADALAEAVEAASALASRESNAPLQPLTCYVVTDRQASTWRDVLDGGGEWSANWRQEASRAKVAARVVLVPVGSTDAQNVVVRSIDVVGGSLVTGIPAEIEVTVQNIGPVQWGGLPMVVSVDRRPLPDVKLNLAADSTTTVRVPIPSGFSEAGTHLISAEIGKGSAGASQRPAGYQSDDRLDVVIDVREPTRVLIVSGDEPSTADAGFTAAEYVAAALAPYRAAGKKGPDPFTVEAAQSDAWIGATVRAGPPPPRTKKPDGARADPPAGPAPAEQRLGRYEVIVLANVERLNEAQSSALEQFVYDGGGLLIVPGPLTRPDALEAALYRDGSGLLPGPLGAPTSADWIDQTVIQSFDAAHPAMRFLGGRVEPFLSVTIGRYFPVERQAAGARALMRYVTDEPFLIEAAPSGRRGRVLLLTTAVDPGWSTLPLSSFFLPLVQSTVRYAGETSARRLNLQPGEAIELPFDESAEGRGVRVKPPDSTDDRPAEIQRFGGQLLARYTETDTPGVYLARVTEQGKRPQVVHFAVTAPRDESTLAALTDAEWARLEQSLDARRIESSVTPISAATALPSPLELWPFALAAVFLLGLLELRLARQWSQTEPMET